MKKQYNGFIIDVNRDKSMTGSVEVFYSISRESDKWILDAGHSESNVRQTMEDCIITIDEYKNNPKDFEE